MLEPDQCPGGDMQETGPRSRRAAARLVRLLGRPLVTGLLAAAAVLAGVAQYVWTQAETYTSVGIVSFAPRGDRQLGADTLEVLSSKYVAYVASPATLVRVAEDSGVSLPDLQEAVDAVIPPATANLSISVTSTDGAAATRLANALSAAVVRQSAVDVNLRADVVAPAVEPDHPSGTPPTLLLLGGSLVAAAVGALTVALLGRGARDGTSRSAGRGPYDPGPAP